MKNVLLAGILAATIGAVVEVQAPEFEVELLTVTDTGNDAFRIRGGITGLGTAGVELYPDLAPQFGGEPPRGVQLFDAVSCPDGWSTYSASQIVPAGARLTPCVRDGGVSPPGAVLTCSVTPAQVTFSNTATLSWSSQNAVEVVFDGQTYGRAGSLTTPSVLMDTMYSLQAFAIGSGASATCTASVTTRPPMYTAASTDGAANVDKVWVLDHAAVNSVDGIFGDSNVVLPNSATEQTRVLLTSDNDLWAVYRRTGEVSPIIGSPNDLVLVHVPISLPFNVGTPDVRKMTGAVLTGRIEPAGFAESQGTMYVVYQGGFFRSITTSGLSSIINSTSRIPLAARNNSETAFAGVQAMFNWMDDLHIITIAVSSGMRSFELWKIDKTDPDNESGGYGRLTTSIGLDARSNNDLITGATVNDGRVLLIYKSAVNPPAQQTWISTGLYELNMSDYTTSLISLITVSGFQPEFHDGGLAGRP